MSSEVLQQLDFAQGSLSEDFLAEDICHFLDCDSFSSLCVRGCAGALSVLLATPEMASVPDDTVCSLTKLFRDGVPLVNNEVLVEHLEDLAA